jgi:endo-1,4-beta-xylanase
MKACLSRYRPGFIAIVIACCAPAVAQPLRDLADQRGIHVGAAADPSHFSENSYSDTLSREFNQLEPENAMKFRPIHPSAGTYNFGPPDSLVAFAGAHNMAVRGHTLVWHNEIPSWVTGGNYTPAQLSGILQDHIGAVVGRYAGQLYGWDVVNEAFNDNGTFRSTLWSDSPGIGLAGSAYIEQCFRWAHAADPQALLFYNDYGDETVNAKSDAIYKMAQDFKSRGVPFDGIGMQMHFTSASGSLTSIDSNIKRITDLGLQVQITELDVRLPVDSSGKATASALATQAQIYHDVVALCLKYALCTAIQTWGFTDRYSWIPASYPGSGAGLEFDQNYQPKPAYSSMIAALETSPPAIGAAGLVNAASYANNAVSPGEIVVLFGATFGPASFMFSQADESGKIPAQLSGTRLLFDGIPAPILYSRVGQVAAIAPFALAGHATTQVQYEYLGIPSDPATVPVAPTQPGVFTLDYSGRGAGVILDASDRLISSANPAHKGDIIVLFATGVGGTTPVGVDGQIVLTGTLPVLSAPASVQIGGVDCPVQYSGGAYGLAAGAFQVKVQVAAGVPSGEQSLVLTVGGAASQSGATVWIQ